jgi:cholesterol transport system auxiliary component
MKKLIPFLTTLFIAGSGALSTGCSVTQSESVSLYDFGPLHTQTSSSLPALAPISIGQVSTPSWLDSTRMYYRLNYANELQPRPYAQARWTMPPAQLLLQQLKARIAQGGVVLATADGALNVPVLHIEADDFTQSFSAPGQSSGQVGLRASVLKGRSLIAQKTFIRQAPAPSADSAGGARALAAASDAAISDLILWLGTLDLK